MGYRERQHAQGGQQLGLGPKTSEAEPTPPSEAEEPGPGDHNGMGSSAEPAADGHPAAAAQDQSR